jgi:hypothetical protein
MIDRNYKKELPDKHIIILSYIYVRKRSSYTANWPYLYQIISRKVGKQRILMQDPAKYTDLIKKAGKSVFHSFVNDS